MKLPYSLPSRAPFSLALAHLRAALSSLSGKSGSCEAATHSGCAHYNIKGQVHIIECPYQSDRLLLVTIVIVQHHATLS